MVVEGGWVTETGGHDELIASGGTYAQLFALQTKAHLARFRDVPGKRFPGLFADNLAAIDIYL